MERFWWCIWCGCLFRAALLPDERFVDVGDDSTTGDGCLDQAVELLVSANGELEMARSDTLDLQVLRSVAGQLENLENNFRHNK